MDAQITMAAATVDPLRSDMLSLWRRRMGALLWRRRPTDDCLRPLEKKLGYGFRDHELLRTALTHPSSRDASGIGDSDNQRLEFLGDAVLAFLVAADLYRCYQEHPEGMLTCLRSRVTNGRMLARIASEIGLGDFIRMAPGEERMGGRERPSTLADTLESVFGAAYLDGGIPATDQIFRRWIRPVLKNERHDIWVDNPKGELQYLTQRMLRQDPRYRVRAQEGSRHEPVFTVEVLVQGEVIGYGSGPNKRQAQSEAARMALGTLAQKRDGEPEFQV